MASKFLTVKGAKEHNLKNVDISVPRDKLVVFTGLSGSGKSSLVNEVLYKTRRVKNGVRYEMKNTGKVASAISPSYAVFEMTEPDGTVHVIFDNSKDYDIKLIKTCIEVVVSFAVVASILTLKTIEDRKKIKQKNK